jgi:hypothetical protein
MDEKLFQQPPGVFDVEGRPVFGHGNELAAADDAAGREVTVGMVGTTALGPTVPIVGETLIVGTAAPELTPRLPIS